MVARELTKKFEEHVGYCIREVIEFFEKKQVIGEITLIVRGKNKNKDEINESDLRKILKS